MEAELRRLTSETEQLTNRVDSIVRDGTNRIGDLEFRLCELETGCDIASLSDTPTLGGGNTPDVAAPVAPSTPGNGGGLDTGGVELAVAEREDFERAKAAFDEGNYELAADRFQAFTDTETAISQQSRRWPVGKSPVSRRPQQEHCGSVPQTAFTASRTNRPRTLLNAMAYRPISSDLATSTQPRRFGLAPRLMV